MRITGSEQLAGVMADLQTRCGRYAGDGLTLQITHTRTGQGAPETPHEAPDCARPPGQAPAAEGKPRSCFLIGLVHLTSDGKQNLLMGTNAAETSHC